MSTLLASRDADVANDGLAADVPVIACLGDGHLGPTIVPGRNSLSFRPDRIVSWLRMLLPEASFPEELALGRPGAMTTALPAALGRLMAARPDVVLVSAGLEDCLATMRGVAPPPDASVALLEAMADMLLGAGTRPAFLVPPPSRHFGNGLFADRYVTIAATLRRLARRDARILLIDPSATMARRGAFGIEPAPGLFQQDEGLLPTTAGALQMAIAAADELRKALGSAGRPQAGSAETLNANPLLRGNLGTIVAEGATGHVASEYRLERSGLPGLACRARALEGGGQRINLSGRYSTNWGFVRLAQPIAMDRVGTLSSGDRIEAIASVSLRGDVKNVAALCLTATPVWKDDFVGLRSYDYPGGVGTGLAFAADLRTPALDLPAALTRLSLSLSLFLRPGSEREVDAELDISSLALRKCAP